VQIYHWEWFAGVAVLHGKGGAGDVPPLHLPNDGDDGQWHFYAFTWDGLILLHDSGYWKAYGNPEGYRLVDDALRKYHFDEHYRMIPYWNQTIVKLPEKVYGSFYVHDGARRVLLVLLNNNDQDRALRLPLDWRALGFTDPRRLRVDDALFHEAVRIEDGVLVTPIGRANRRLLAIEETP
jgi:hypothetical protein